MPNLLDAPLARETLAELGEQDYDAADFFELYGSKIEARVELRRRPGPVADSTRVELLELLSYFQDEPALDYRLWPHRALRALAMVAPIQVAMGLLGISEDALELAIRSQRPNKDWQWWRDLGEAILTGSLTIGTDFDLTPRAVHKYTVALVGYEHGKAA